MVELSSVSQWPIKDQEYSKLSLIRTPKESVLICDVS